MKNIDLTSLLSKLIKDYEKIYGMQNFEIKKINNLFIHTNINQNIIESFKNLSLNYNLANEKTLSDFPISKDFKEKMLLNYETAWKGKEIVDFYFFADCEIIIVFSLNAIQQNRKTVRLEGHCVLLDSKKFSNLNMFPN